MPALAPKPLRSLRQDGIKQYLSKPDYLDSQEPKGNHRSSSQKSNLKPKLTNFGGQKNGFEINDFISKYEEGVKKRAFYIQKEKELQIQKQELLKLKSKEMQNQYTKFKLKQDQKI